LAPDEQILPKGSHPDGHIRTRRESGRAIDLPIVLTVVGSLLVVVKFNEKRPWFGHWFGHGFGHGFGHWFWSLVLVIGLVIV